MTSTKPRTRRCVASHLGCTCADQPSHSAWISTRTRSVRGTELRDGDIVFVGGLWREINDVTVAGETVRTTVAAGRTSGNALATYDVFTG